MRVLPGSLALAMSAWAVAASAAEPGKAPLDFTTYPLPGFRIGEPEETAFGALEWIGGFEIEADSEDFGGVSGLVVDAEDRLLAVEDNGFFFSARILRDADGRPVGLSDGLIGPLVDGAGNLIAFGRDSDIESIDRAAGGSVYLSAEGPSRVFGSRARQDGLAPLASLFMAPDIGLRGNKGFETVAVGPPGGALAGSVVAIAERPPTGAEEVPAFIIGGAAAGTFSIVPQDGFDVTDGKFTPAGDLILLERYYGLGGLAMRVSRIAGAGIAAGARVTPETLMEAGLGHQIDNMEGLALWQDAADATRIAIISDDNHAIFQRTLYLEFRLAE